jgi:3-hydroxyisobutyrate dehydrogenase
MLDCPISGAPQQVRNGGAVLFGSGEREAFDRAEPVLRAISPRVHYVGAFGHGMRAKCTAYILVAGHTLVAAEALAFARKAGLSPADILAMLSGTINSSAVFEQRAPQILNPVGASGNSHGFGQSLAPAHRLAAELGAPTPVLTEVLRRIARLPGDAADEPVAALYHQLTDPAEERA